MLLVVNHIRRAVITVAGGAHPPVVPLKRVIGKIAAVSCLVNRQKKDFIVGVLTALCVIVRVIQSF